MVPEGRMRLPERGPGVRPIVGRYHHLMPTRCAWVPDNDELYVPYHDREWGVPLHDERRLFELLCLEGAQAGLSWRTILARREGYRAVFADFDPDRLAEFDDDRLAAILLDPRIIRNRLKVFAARDNARAVVQLRGETTLSRLLWDFVGGVPIVNAWQSIDQVPAVTPLAESMSRALRKLGFRFVGPTICYAFMQSAGLVNDHVVDCFRFEEVGRASD
jgi:DNA-3-methyladenine glycosylase I